MKRFLSFLRRRWFRLLAGGFFLLLLLLYTGFKYVFTESFVRSRVLPMLERGMRRDIEIDSVEGGVVFGFIARGVRFKEPLDMGHGDHMIVEQVRIRPDWWELLHGRIVIAQAEASGVAILFRKLGYDRGTWMPDQRYPQLKGKEIGEPFRVESISVRDLEYRFVDEVTGFKSVVRVPQFAGSLNSDRNVVVAVRGNWVIDSLVFGKPLDERHIPAMACEGLITSYTREKRTDMRVSAFKGAHHVDVSGFYDWAPGDSYIRLTLLNGVADLEGEYFRSLFPGFLPLEGRSTYSGTVYKGGPDTMIHIDAFTPEAFVKQPGFDGRPLRQVDHTVDFEEHGRQSEIVWEATGALCALPGTGACDLPFQAALHYAPLEDLLTVRAFHVLSPGLILDSSGFVWFPENGRPSLGLEGTGSVDPASEAGTALFAFAGMPLEASMEYRADLRGPAEAPVLILTATAPVLSASPPWFDEIVQVKGLTGKETFNWKEEGGVIITGNLRGGSIVRAQDRPPARPIGPLFADHEILYEPRNNDWKVNSVEIRIPEANVRLDDPFWIGRPPQAVRFRGRVDVGGIAALFAPDSGFAVEGDLSLTGFWEPNEDPVGVSLSATGTRLEIAASDGGRGATFEDPRVVALGQPGPGDAFELGFRVRSEELQAELVPGRRRSLGQSQVAAEVRFPRGAAAVDFRTFELRSPGLVLAGTREESGKPRENGGPDWLIGATGDLRWLIDALAGPESVSATGTLEVTGRVKPEGTGISFDGNWNTPWFGIVMPRSGTVIEMREAAGNQWWKYERGRHLTARGVIGSASSLVRSGTREVVLGPAEAGAGLSWQEKDARLDLNQAWLESDRLGIHLSGETELGGGGGAKSHFVFDVDGPLEVLWPAVAGKSATDSVAPGTGEIRVDGEFWRGDGSGRAVFRARADELRFGSFTGQTALAAQAGPHADWSWEGDIEVGKIVYGEHVSTDHRYHVRSENHHLWLDRAACTVGDGTVVAVGGADFSGPEPRLSGALWIDDSDLAAWLPSFVTDATGTVGGIASATAVWSASGTGARELGRTLRAGIRAWIKDGFFHRTPTTVSISTVLGIDELQNVDVYWADSEMRIEDETLYLDDLDMETNYYRAEMEGRIGFNGSQDLRMIMNLPVPLVSRVPFLLGLEKLFPSEVPVGVKITGNVRDPKVSVFRYSLLERPAGAFGSLIRSFGKLFGAGNGDKEKREEDKSQP